MTALLFAAVVAVNGVSPALLLELPFVTMLIAVAAIDLEHRIVPNRVVVPAALWAVAAGAVVNPDALVGHLAAGAAAFGALLLLALAYPGGIGMGDVKLAGTMGLYLGAAVAPALFAAFLAGSIVGVATMVREGTAARKLTLPFAPFLALGGLVGLLVGPELLATYLGLARLGARPFACYFTYEAEIELGKPGNVRTRDGIAEFTRGGRRAREGRRVRAAGRRGQARPPELAAGAGVGRAHHPQ